MVVAPAYSREGPSQTVEQRRRALIGYAIGIWNMENLLRRGLITRTKATTSYRLMDRTSAAGNQFLAALRPTFLAPDPLDPPIGTTRHEVPLDFAGRMYVLECMENLRLPLAEAQTNPATEALR
jgi:hypothetical protein